MSIDVRPLKPHKRVDSAMNKCCDSGVLRCGEKERRAAASLKSKKLSAFGERDSGFLIAKTLRFCVPGPRHKMKVNRAIKRTRGVATPVSAIFKVILCHCLLVSFSLAILSISTMRISTLYSPFRRDRALSFLSSAVPMRAQTGRCFGRFRAFVRSA